MDEGETKTCENCKRDIPAVNFTIHSIHCARNIRMCPVCKEPFLQAELQRHHDKMHKLMPCKQCGERVCGTDLEDHIRDSCAHTMVECRFCSLELRRSAAPAHERYCGARTERCTDCGERVMLKYRQLHLDSNHGFLRLPDDPPPFALDKPIKMLPKNVNGVKDSNVANGISAPKTEIRYFNTSTSYKENNVEPSSSNGAVPLPKRTNDQPQINTTVEPTNKVNKHMSISRGAIKKRPAPKPPAREPNPDPKRDLPFYSALRRQQQEERQRREQTESNLAQGLPPVLSPLEKYEKLRKMDALQNGEIDFQVKTNKKNRIPDRLRIPGEQDVKNKSEPSRRNDLKGFQPMTNEEFVERLGQLQLAEEPRHAGNGDRFSQIKSSLKELRRDLNEVTAPYNSNANADMNHNRNTPPEEEVRLPCEFCGLPVPSDDLVLHQTGCRPDLVGLITTAIRQDERAGPLIPCEFCDKHIPITHISQHQKRCGRDNDCLC